MIEEKVIIQNEIGLHARPASAFNREAAKYQCGVEVIKNGKRYDAKSIIGILSMGAMKGDEIKIITDGEDEQEAMKSIVELLEHGLNHL